MAMIGFIGLGNMGAPMMRNLLKAGHQVRAFDVSQFAIEEARRDGADIASSAADAAQGAEIVITMLPAGKHVHSAYLGEGGVLAAVSPGTLLIDSSTIDVSTSRLVHQKAEKAGSPMVDAPVSGGVGGAAAGTLTFMVGGSVDAFRLAEPVLSAMGKAVIHAGGPGNGQAAKICNNMLLGISMIGVCEAFALGQKLGLDAQALFDISSKSSGQCWSMTSYCPVPGPVPGSPANNDYKPGFTAEMMLKDLKLAQEAAHLTTTPTPLGASAQALYAMFCENVDESVDFSAIMRMISGKMKQGRGSE